MKARTTFPCNETNVGKLRALDSLYSEYIQYMEICVQKMVINQKTNVFPSERKTFFTPSTVLSSQVYKNAQVQAVELVSTWVAGLYQRTLKKYIYLQKLPEHETLQLYTIGKYRLTHGGKFGRATVSQELVDLYWSWVWNPEIVGNPPAVGPRTPMKLTEMTCTFKESKTSYFKGWWLLFSGLVRNKRVPIPLKETSYLTSSKEVALSVLARKNPEGDWVFQFTDKTPSTEPVGTRGKVGVDVGLNILAATSDGTLYGQQFKSKFDLLRKRVLDIRANRQRQEIKKDSRRLWKLEQRLSGQIKTATGTVANQLVAKYPNHTFVVEDLDLSGCKGSKRFAYKALQHSLETKAVTEKVNPAYSSQTCPSCGSVSRNNRTGTKFHCRSCGRLAHSDYVGGLNLLRRSEDKQISLKTPVKSVKVILERRYLSNRSRPQRLLLVGACTVKPVAYCMESSGASTCIATNTTDESQL